MKAKLIIVGLIWLVPVACCLGVSRADRAFAAAVGTLFAVWMTFFLVRQPMLRCGACGAKTPYFDNYSPLIARLQGNWRRYFVCYSCGEAIDRMTGQPVVGVPETPAVPAASRSDIGCAVAGLGGLLFFSALVMGVITLLGISQNAAQPDRAKTVLLWCAAAAIAGIFFLVAGLYSSFR